MKGRVKVRPSDAEIPALVRLGCDWASSIKPATNIVSTAKRTAADAGLDDLDDVYAKNPHAAFKQAKDRYQEYRSLSETIQGNLHHRVNAEMERRQKLAAENQQKDIEHQSQLRQKNDVLRQKDAEIEALKAELARRGASDVKMPDVRDEQAERLRQLESAVANRVEEKKKPDEERGLQQLESAAAELEEKKRKLDKEYAKEGQKPEPKPQQHDF